MARIALVQQIAEVEDVRNLTLSLGSRQFILRFAMCLALGILVRSFFLN